MVSSPYLLPFEHRLPMVAGASLLTILAVSADCGGGASAISPDARIDSGIDSVVGGDGSLNPSRAPGSNFNLSSWELQEPVGSAGSPTTITSAALAAGFHDSYFFTDPSDGAMTFW